MTSTIVEIGEARIKTTITCENSEINRVVKAFLSNDMNKKKIIGLDTERALVGRFLSSKPMSRPALLQLCDGKHCLIVQLLSYNDYKYLPNSLFNFLNLPDFTFVGIGINKTLMNLETEFGLTCKNAFEIGPSKWDMNTNMPVETYSQIHKFISLQKPTTPIFDLWGCVRLNKDQIKFAAANAYSAFGIGNV